MDIYHQQIQEGQIISNLREYIDEMMNEYDVVIHTSAFVPAEPNQPIEAPTTK